MRRRWSAARPRTRQPSSPVHTAHDSRRGVQLVMLQLVLWCTCGEVRVQQELNEWEETKHET